MPIVAALVGWLLGSAVLSGCPPNEEYNLPDPDRPPMMPHERDGYRNTSAEWDEIKRGYWYRHPR